MRVDPSPWASFLEAWDLFRAPIFCAVVAGGVLGFLGIYVVSRRMVFLSAAVAQSSALGVALAFYAQIHLGLNVDPLAGAVGLGVLTVSLLSGRSHARWASGDVLLGVAYAVAGGAVVLVGDRIAQEAHDIQGLLFGTAVLVRPGDAARVAAVGLSLLALHLVFFRGFTFAAFDAPVAAVQGLPVRLLNAALMLGLGLMIGVSARALGALPVFAFSVLPAATAWALGVSLRGSFALAAALGAVAGGAGYVLAYVYELPVGGAQTTLAGLFTLAAMAWPCRSRSTHLESKELGS